MAKKSRKLRKRVSSLPQIRRRHVFIIAILFFATSATALLNWIAAEPIRIAPPPAQPSNNLSPGNPSKEYIYAGSRLVAIEERAGGTLAAPIGLVAIGGSGAQISLGWAASAGAHHYQIERSNSLSGDFSVVSFNVASNSFIDSSVTQGSAYLYRVRAADPAGNLSPPSNIDLATAMAFTDDPLVRATPATTGTTIKAVHLAQLRQAVNAVRIAADLSAASWTHPDPVSSPAGQRRNIFLRDVLDLRSALDEALARLGLQQPYQTDPTLTGGVVKAAHFQEIRERVK